MRCNKFFFCLCCECRIFNIKNCININTIFNNRRFYITKFSCFNIINYFVCNKLNMSTTITWYTIYKTNCIKWFTMCYCYTNFISRININCRSFICVKRNILIRLKSIRWPVLWELINLLRHHWSWYGENITAAVLLSWQNGFLYWKCWPVPVKNRSWGPEK